QLVATALFLWAGALAGWSGWAALAVAVASWVGLFFLFLESRKARSVIEAALREGLGDDYRDRIAPDLAGGLDETWRLRQRLLPLPMWDRRVERIRNIVFHKAGGVNLKLDVYRPRNRSGLCPTVLFVHGGAWVLGNKDTQG